MIQLALAAFGLTALYMAMSRSDSARRWAPQLAMMQEAA